jgi:glycosyltransferase involved in cell wall biosynthesis
VIIGIDGNEANNKKRVGSNEYAFQILSNIWKIYNSEFRIKNENLKFRIYLKNAPLLDLPKETFWWQYKVLKPSFLWTQWRLPLELYFGNEKPDIFFTPGHYAPRFCPCPLVISIMDLAFLRFPDQFRKKDLYTLINWTKRSVEQASHILTISEFTKKEIIHFYHYPEKRITVTYPGIEISNLKSQMSKLNLKTKIFKKYNIKNKYLLYIGTLQPRKNLVRLIEVLNILISQYPNIQLVIVGKKGWFYEEIFNKVKELDLEDKVLFTGFLPEEEKTVFLQNALALVLPSLYEGFGIPVLEAMQQGCPAVVSRSSSLPEVAGKAGVYIDNPLSCHSIQNALLKMVKLVDKDRKELINKGFQQVKKFSWQKSARQTWEVLCSTLKLRPVKN